jgi:hypothetical protein
VQTSKIISRPSGGVTRKAVGFGKLTGFIGHLKFLTIHYSGAVANSNSIQFTIRSTWSFQSVTLPVLRYWLQTAGRCVPGFPNFPRVTATATLMLVYNEMRSILPLYGHRFIQQETSQFSARVTMEKRSATSQWESVADS